MSMVSLDEPDISEFVEVDPTGRYGRYKEVLGKGASKTVYRAFDEYEGIEVAWNQVKLYDFLQSPEDLERLYCEIHLLKTLKHKNIMKFYTSWVDTANRNINFVTEMFTSGTLRQYRLKHKRVNIRAVKHWCRQILKGLLYLHSHDPPVIHRDLKCDNIFINGNQGEVKIGDLGLAAILRKSHADRCVGTPEFMAPEVYEEAYNELVDIYSFGMCILEMVTFEYPYSECTHPAQIYKKVISGKKPDALYKVQDPELRQLVEKCLATVTLRLSARELLADPFLQIDDFVFDLRALDYESEVSTNILVSQPYFVKEDGINSYHTGCSYSYDYEAHNDWEYHPYEIETSGLELFEHHDGEHSEDLDVSIKGKKRDDGSIFLRLRIADKEGRIRNIYFPFDIENDTALSVATEMVAELDITDQDVSKIANIIDEEIASLVPEWRIGPGIEETPRFANQTLCNNCASTCTSNGSLMEYLSSNLCCRHGCASMHGRFEEITFQADESNNHFAEGTTNALSQSNCLHGRENWGQQESRQLTPMSSGGSHSDEEYEDYDHPKLAKDGEATDLNKIQSSARKSIGNFTGSSSLHGRSSYNDLAEESDVQWLLRWLRAKYQMELRTLKDQQLGVVPKASKPNVTKLRTSDWVLSWSTLKSLQEDRRKDLARPSSNDNYFSHLRIHMPNGYHTLNSERTGNSELINESNVTAMSCYSGSLLPHSLHRTTSLPVDAVDGV